MHIKDTTKVDARQAPFGNLCNNAQWITTFSEQFGEDMKEALAKGKENDVYEEKDKDRDEDSSACIIKLKKSDKFRGNFRR